MNIQNYLADKKKRVDKYSQHILINSPGRLGEAIQYSYLNGGKKLRPALTYIIGEMFGSSLEELDAAACAIEFVHTYSLIHDDLPAMDNDDLRRGKPTCHKAFDEATAILAGDALLTEAFAILANKKLNPVGSESQIAMIIELANLIGYNGMLHGQMLDISATGKQLSQVKVNKIHCLKTGCLFKAAVKLGYLANNSDDGQAIQLLEEYSELLGLAFQIQDDILECTSNEQQLGKSISDIVKNKSTYVVATSLEKAQKEFLKLTTDIYRKIDYFGKKGDILHALTSYILKRKN